MEDSESMAIGMPKDHIGLAKFSDEADRGFRQLVEPLQELARNAPSIIAQRWRGFKGWWCKLR
jgi:hypothetical protein